MFLLIITVFFLRFSVGVAETETVAGAFHLYRVIGIACCTLSTTNPCIGMDLYIVKVIHCLKFPKKKITLRKREWERKKKRSNASSKLIHKRRMSLT